MLIPNSGYIITVFYFPLPTVCSNRPFLSSMCSFKLSGVAETTEKPVSDEQNCVPSTVATTRLCEPDELTT